MLSGFLLSLPFSLCYIQLTGDAGMGFSFFSTLLIQLMVLTFLEKIQRFLRHLNRFGILR
ncbi:hypothetical protein OBV_01790 [Oscillibacter valericigenes Sjm18-20]|nr:hypothetical protein OBV_01790 [Oscillibacter valericigenes Sjm18-20]